MSVVLLLALLASFATLCAAVILFSDGEAARARRILLYWTAGATAYAAVLIVVAMLPRQTAFKTGVPYCDDDVCISVDKVTRAKTSVRMDVRLSSLANHGPRSTDGASAYLIDERNNRYPCASPFEFTLQPRQSLSTTLIFNVPADAQNLSFAASMDHIRYASFIIGIGDLLHHPRVQFPLAENHR
jgi:hypothetical protein